MSYIHGTPILDVSLSHTTTQHSRQDSSGRVISSSQRPLPDNTRHSQQTNIHAPGGICTHDLSRRAATGRSPAEILYRIYTDYIVLYIQNISYCTYRIYHTVHTEFSIPYVSDVIHERINIHHNKMEAHSNPLLEPLLQSINTRRLKRC